MGNAETSLYVAAASGQTAMVELLLARGARVDVANRVGGSPLYMAAQCGRVEILKILAAAGADVDQGRTDDSSVGGSSPLLMACTSGHAAVVKALAELGADLDSRNNNGMTPLMAAAFFGKSDCAVALLEAGCDAAVEHDFPGPAVMFNVEKVPRKGRAGAAKLARDRGFVALGALVARDGARRALVGEAVVVRGTSREDINGTAGTAARYDAAKDRYDVALEGFDTALSFRASNVRRPGDDGGDDDGGGDGDAWGRVATRDVVAANGWQRVVAVDLPLPATRLAFSRGGRLAAVHGSPMSSFAVALLELEGDGARTAPDYVRNTTEVAWSPDGGRLACSVKGNVHVVDVDRPHEVAARCSRPEINQGMMQQMFTFGELAVLALAWNGAGLVVGGFEDTTVRCWRVDGGDERAYVMKWAMTRHTAEVAAVAFDPSGEFVISGSADGTVRLTRAATGRCARVFRCGPEPVPEVVPSWNRRTRLPSRPVTLPVVAVASVAAPGGVLFAAYVDAARTPDISARLSFGAGRADDHAATNGPQIWALDLPEDDALDEPPTELSPDDDDDDDDDDDPGHIDWAAAAARLAEQRGRVELVVPDETDEEAEAEAPRNLVSEDKRLHRCVVPSNRGGGSVAFSPCGRFLATAAEAPSTPLAGDGRCKMKAGYVTQIHVFDTASGAPIATIDTTSQETSHVAWSPCGSALVAAGMVYPGGVFDVDTFDDVTGVVEIYRAGEKTTRAGTTARLVLLRNEVPSHVAGAIIETFLGYRDWSAFLRPT